MKLEDYRPYGYLNNVTDQPVTAEAPTFQSVGALNATDLPNGTYKVCVEIVWLCDDTVTDVSFRLDSQGDTGGILVTEPKDSSEIRVEPVSRIVFVTAGTIDLEVFMAKQAGLGGNVIARRVFIDYERKLEATS